MWELKKVYFFTEITNTTLLAYLTYTDGFGQTCIVPAYLNSDMKWSDDIPYAKGTARAFLFEAMRQKWLEEQNSLPFQKLLHTVWRK